MGDGRADERNGDGSVYRSVEMVLLGPRGDGMWREKVVMEMQPCDPPFRGRIQSSVFFSPRSFPYLPSSLVCSFLFLLACFPCVTHVCGKRHACPVPLFAVTVAEMNPPAPRFPSFLCSFFPSLQIFFFTSFFFWP